MNKAQDPRVDCARVRGGSQRLVAAVQDFLLDPAQRLTEQERALMNAMLHGLVERLADEIRVRLPAALAAASECDPAELVGELSRSGLLAKPALIDLLLRRADLLRLGQPGAGAKARGENALLGGWVADEVADVAAAAMAVTMARSAARDRFGRPGLELADCPAEIAVDLAYDVAAALASRCGGHDEEVVAAAVDLLARHDEGRRLDALEARLVRALQEARRLDPATLLALAGAGEVGLLCEALARLAGIPGESGWALFIDGKDGRLALLLRMAEQPRAMAAALLARLAGPLGLADPGAELDWFDRIGDAEAVAARNRLRLPPAYQRAVAALERHGQRLA
uniref:DUF2336 domain-containing protein n=1 Tax=uncultured Sphingomonas sp. TaxID=158754 RepID=UPI0025EA88BA|nr:DUF2336 domain-containing protein [uncultured Sphingomonas sp.]